MFLLNSGGDFSSVNGRGLAFFSDRFKITEETLIDRQSTEVEGYLDKAGVNSDGISIFTLTVPEGAVSMVVNTAFTQYNPNGFSVYISLNKNDIYEKLASSQSGKVISLYDEKILGLSEDDMSLIYSGNLSFFGNNSARMMLASVWKFIVR